MNIQLHVHHDHFFFCSVNVILLEIRRFAPSFNMCKKKKENSDRAVVQKKSHLGVAVPLSLGSARQ